MPFAVCSVHGARDARKYATVYSAWFKADGVRTAWKQRLCPEAFKAVLLPVISNASSDSLDVSECPVCKQDASQDLDPIYLNVYLPKLPEREYQLPTCSPCAAILRIQLLDGAEQLQDRQRDEAIIAAESPDWGF